MSLIEGLKGTVIVSCQAREGEPFNAPQFIVEFAKSAEMANASALRINNGENIKAVKKSVKLPIIGIRKKYIEGTDVYITPGLKEVEEIINAGADIVAMDGTNRQRGNGCTLKELIEFSHQHNKPVLADVATMEDAEYALTQGADYLATTLNGYTAETKRRTIPDFDFLRSLTMNFQVPVFLEGGVTDPEQVTKAFELGAYGVIVGKAITMPHFIAKQYVQKAKLFSQKRGGL